MGAIFLVRHGQASFGAADYDQLSELGQRQSARLGEALRARLPAGAVAIAVAGRMRRHRQTAEACLAALGAPATLELDGGWDEYDHQALFGALDARFADQRALAEEVARSPDPARAFQDLFARAVARWVEGAHDGDYREPWRAFCARVDGALAALVGRLARSQSALVFTSGGPIARACGQLMRVPPESQLPLAWTLANAGVSKLIVRGEAVQLGSLNEHAHFDGEARALLTYR